MIRNKIYFIFLLLIIKPGFCQQNDYSWPLPDNWVEEFIPFPLKFAPELNYHGIEEIHFMPGWRGNDSLSDQRWSYTFAWYLDTLIYFNEERLQKDLIIYFDGLQNWVQKNSLGYIPLNVPPEIRIKRAGKNESQKFSGTAEILDIFFTNKPIRLNMKISLLMDLQVGKTLVLFELSPKPFRHPTWKLLDDHISEFKIKGLSDS